MRVNYCCQAAVAIAAGLLSFQGLCMNISFTHADESKRWAVSNDTVMGGVSASRVVIDNGALMFSGRLSLDNNGGFTSVWRAPQKQLANTHLPISIRVKGDGRTYQLRLRTQNAGRISYAAEFETQANTWTTHTFSAQQFTPVWRGRIVSNAPALSFTDVDQVGFLLADKIEARFNLEVEYIVQANQA